MLDTWSIHTSLLQKREPKMTEKPSTQLTMWEDEMAKAAKAVAKTERASVNKISFKSGVMTYMDSPMKDNILDCVVLAAVKENVYYTEKYRAADISPPACFALALPEDDLIPHADVPEPQSTTCSVCPMFQWGSDPEGGRGKACKERRRLAVIPLPSSAAERPVRPTQPMIIRVALRFRPSGTSGL